MRITLPASSTQKASTTSAPLTFLAKTTETGNVNYVGDYKRSRPWSQLSSVSVLYMASSLCSWALGFWKQPSDPGSRPVLPPHTQCPTDTPIPITYPSIQNMKHSEKIFLSTQIESFIWIWQYSSNHLTIWHSVVFTTFEWGSDVRLAFRWNVREC